jgi:archaellin
MVSSSQEGRTTAPMVMIALVVALGVMGAVVITIFVIQQEAEAVGCKTGTAANASKGRCIKG